MSSVKKLTITTIDVQDRHEIHKFPKISREKVIATDKNEEMRKTVCSNKESRYLLIA